MHTILHKKRHLLYGFVIWVGLFILDSLHKSFEPSLYLLGCMIMYVVILVELILTSDRYHKYTDVDDSIAHQKTVLIAHHVLLPTILYFSAVAYLFFNTSTIIDFTVITVVSILFAIFYDNVYSFYHGNKTEFHHTHYIYDILSIITLYISTVSLLQSVNLIGNVLLVLLLSLSFIFHGYLLLRRYAAHADKIFMLAISIVILICTTILFSAMDSVSAIAVGFFVSIVYTALTLYISHPDKRKLTFDVVLEFILITFICFAIIRLYGV